MEEGSGKKDGWENDWEKEGEKVENKKVVGRMMIEKMIGK